MRVVVRRPSRPRHSLRVLLPRMQHVHNFYPRRHAVDNDVATTGLHSSSRGELVSLGLNQRAHFRHNLIVRDARLGIVQRLLNFGAKPLIVADRLFLSFEL